MKKISINFARGSEHISTDFNKFRDPNEVRGAYFYPLSTIHCPLFAIRYLLFFICYLLFAVCLSAGVVINEFVYDADGTDTGYEWIELYNNTSADISIGGWKIQFWDEEEGFEDAIVIPITATVKAYGYYLIGQSLFAKDFEEQSSVEKVDLIYDDNLGMTNSPPACIRLVNSSDVEIDRVAYEDTYPDIIAGEGNTSAGEASGGASLTRDPDGYDTDNNQSDFYENEFPTPRSSKYGTYRKEGVCYAVPNPYYPRKQTCKIIAPESCGSLNMMIEIYDLSGMLVKRIVGTNEWDGKNSEGDYVGTGNYFIVYSATKGKAKGVMTIIK